MLCHFQTQQVVWMSTAVCVKMSFTPVCTSSLTHFALVSWPQTRYLVTAKREKSCKDSLSLRCNEIRQHSQPDDSFILFFLALHLTASYVLYRVVKSPLMCRKQFTLYQRWRQGAIFWALHFYSSHHIKPGWQQLAGMDCCASVRFQQWYCLLKPLSTSSSMFMSTWLGATCFSENAQISEEYVNRHTFVMQDRFVQLQCHSCWQDGVGSVCFTPDSQTLITTGLRDGSLVCSRLRWAQGSQKTSNGQILL